jgi:hypothetical protein
MRFIRRGALIGCGCGIVVAAFMRGFVDKQKASLGFPQEIAEIGSVIIPPVAIMGGTLLGATGGGAYMGWSKLNAPQRKVAISILGFSGIVATAYVAGRNLK